MLRTGLNQFVCLLLKSSCVGGLFFLWCCTSVQAQDFLYHTIESDPVSQNANLHAVHVSYLQSPSIAEVSYAGEQLFFPVYTLSIGLGDKAEMWIKFPVYQSLNDPVSGINLSDGGDPEFYTKVKFLNEQGLYPAMAFVYGLKEAATNPPLGTDEHDAFAFLTLSNHHQSFEYHLNFGVGILGNTRNSSDQAHTMIFRSKVLKPRGEKLTLGLELDYRTRLSGQWFQFNTPVDDALNRVSIGVGGRYQLAHGHSVGLKFTSGMIEQSEHFGMVLGYEYRSDGL